MNRLLLHLCGTLAFCLAFACGGLQARTLTGPEVVQQLNQAYASTPERCVGNRPAYYCSGVMSKPILSDDPQPFWRHGPDAIGHGAERFDFLRRDVLPGSTVGEHGYLFSNRFTAIGQGKDYLVVGDDGMNRPPELRVRNWEEAAPLQLPLIALFHRRTAAGLAAALRDQRSYFEATGQWLPIVRWSPDDESGPLFGFDEREQSYSGYQVAERLNQRYADTTTTCRDGRSAIYCRGVLVRGIDYSEDFHSWDPSPGSVIRDGISFSYVGADIGVDELYQNQGLIFHELGRPSAFAVKFRCAYPHNAQTSLTDYSCRATCASENITSVAAWRASRYPANPSESCAFGDTPQEIQLNADVRHGYSWTPTRNELVFAAWPPGIPSELPIEAFYWVVGTSGLTGARFVQHDYLTVTGRFMPVVRVELTATAGSKFVYDPADQNY